MTYAASYCSWKQHAEQLRLGGELLTLVSLLTAHFGLSTQIRRSVKAEEQDAESKIEQLSRCQSYVGSSELGPELAASVPGLANVGRDGPSLQLVTQ